MIILKTLNLCSCSVCLMHRSMFQMNMLYVPLSVCREQGTGSVWVSGAQLWFGRALPLLGGTRMKSWGGITLDWTGIQTISQLISQQSQTVWKMIISKSNLHSTYISWHCFITWHAAGLWKCLFFNFCHFYLSVCDSGKCPNIYFTHMSGFIWWSNCTDCTVALCDCVLKIDSS